MTQQYTHSIANTWGSKWIIYKCGGTIDMCV